METINLDIKIVDKIKRDKDECTDCKLCFNKCPMMKEFSSSPKNLMKEILDGTVDYKSVAYSCMLCGLCNQKCKKNIDLGSTFYQIRENIALKDKKTLRKKGYSIVKFHQMNSFSPIFSKDLNTENARVVFLPGCSLSSYSDSIVKKIYKYLQKHYKDIGMTFKCCGKPTKSMGEVEKFNKYYDKIESLISNNEIEEIIVACPNCYNTLSKNSKSIKITSLYEVIKDKGIPKNLKNNFENITCSVHDSCSIRYEKCIHDSVRYILKELGINIVEFENCRENTVCCGAGGMVAITNSEVSLKQINRRVNETKCENIVCYCQSCCESLLNSDKNIFHILDLIFNEYFINKNVVSQSTENTLKKWKNRYKTVRIKL
ncbi:(Fe-S)-binding protein [Paraclostridium sordellii]|uniref:(Fe-S)-binding protein n=1 Tax=Paraclostridium sordellii TaxID=1505 RepID=UPI0009BE5BF6|nr:(Fe-S)-binding protein [Paeniclostridium sordellii]